MILLAGRTAGRMTAGRGVPKAEAAGSGEVEVTGSHCCRRARERVFRRLGGCRLVLRRLKLSRRMGHEFHSRGWEAELGMNHWVVVIVGVGDRDFHLVQETGEVEVLVVVPGKLLVVDRRLVRWGVGTAGTTSCTS